jgi:tRNA (guanine37-N1)-methyltransferase
MKMYALKADLADAEKAKRILIEKELLDQDYLLKKDESNIYFPMKKNIMIKSFEVVRLDFEKRERPKAKDLKILLSEKLSKKELEKIKTSFDVVGDIAILEIDAEFRKKEKMIANTLLDSNPSIKTVLRKDDVHSGEFRTQKMKYLAGEKRKETIHTENGVRLKLNVETVYFSPRLSTERKRIAEQVRKGEDILVMFSGCAPYCCVLAKNAEAKNILGIEINPEGHRYGLENLKLNKIGNVQLINGDVKTEVPRLKRKFDRILMPLPKSAEDFLDSALIASKKGTIVHFYDFLHEDNFADAERKVAEACRRNGVKWKKLALVKCGQHAPRTFRVCLDFQII